MIRKVVDRSAIQRAPSTNAFATNVLAPMPRSPYEIELVDHQSAVPCDPAALKRAVRTVLAGEGIDAAEISVSVVDDPTIHQLNRRHLNHDWPTDVISFLFSRSGQTLEGEVIASMDTARRTAERLGGSAADELTLYVVHGVLHLCGYDDLQPDALAAMREKEREYLARLGMTRRSDEAEG